MFLRLVFSFIFIFNWCSASAQDPIGKDDGLLEWSSEFLDMVGGELASQWDYQGAQLSNSIFESLTNLQIFGIDFVEDGPNLKLKVERKVYDNHDINDSWNVADFFRMPLTIPIYVISDIPLGMFKGGISIKNELAVNVLNVRQVLPKNFPKLPKLKDLEKQAMELQQNLKLKGGDDEFQYDGEGGCIEFMTYPDSSAWGGVDKKKNRKKDSYLRRKSKELFESSKGRARYSRLFNLLSHPFRVPVTEGALNNMEAGEISSYSLDGSIQLGGNVGWEILPIPTGKLAMGTELTTYLTGKFRISVLKEDERYVKLKVTRRVTRGNIWQFGSTDTKQTVFEGLLIWGGQIGKINARVIPFSLAVNEANARTFDIGYRYDMNNPHARQAYFEATRGLLKQSDELAFVEDGVEKIFVRKQRSRTISDHYQMKLSLFYHRAHNHVRTDAEAMIFLPDGEHHVFKGIAQDVRNYDSLWGDKESKNYQFHVTIDEDEYKNSDDGMALRIQVQLDDSRTRGNELLRYTREVEEIIGDDNLFGEFPLYYPLRNCDEQGGDCKGIKRMANYGRSSFYYRLSFNRNQLERFIHYPEKLMWPIVEKAFGVKEDHWKNVARRWWYDVQRFYAKILNVPLALVDVNIHDGQKITAARRFIRRWRKLRDTKSFRDLSRGFAKLFTTRYFNYEYVRVIKVFFENEEFAYNIDAKNNRTFGHINKTGKTLQDADVILDRADKEVEFDRLGTRNDVDIEAVIMSLKTKVIDDDTIEVEYVLKNKPKYLFFRVDKSPSWNIAKTLTRFVISAKGIFSDETGSFILRRGEGSNETLTLLADALFSTKYATLAMAYSNNGRQWGAVRSSRLRVPSPTKEKMNN